MILNHKDTKDTEDSRSNKINGHIKHIVFSYFDSTLLLKVRGVLGFLAAYLCILNSHTRISTRLLDLLNIKYHANRLIGYKTQ